MEFRRVLFRDAGGKACLGNTYDDGNGHGTHAAGTIAARDDSAGVVGVAPGAPIWSVRVLDSSGGGSTSSLLAICGSVARGVTIVAAAGNDARDFAGELPAAYDEVLTVTAVSDTNGRPG